MSGNSENSLRRLVGWDCSSTLDGKVPSWNLTHEKVWWLSSIWSQKMTEFSEIVPGLGWL